ncbi:SDR family NAD(P)-dependent oxidoreductase [Novosphingobium bradum]|uniref:SDR family NAD(P)-dependent oxidoreductase n=1 Tax=Novosphingobium bradum TaxID=1737444 RepID=A0ABV7ISN6_9SPHN
MSWAGKVAVVTGGAMGIGGATADLLAGQGARVVIFDTDPAAADRVARIVAAGGEAIAVTGSVAAEADVQALASRAVEAFGRIDLLVNNAGIMGRHDSLADWPLAQIRQVLDVNLLGTFLCSYLLAPVMAKTGGGSIVSVSSFGAIVPVPYSPPYSATKAGVLGMVRSMAPSFAAIGVRVNAVLPALTATPMALASAAAQSVPMLAPDDLARAIAHVGADASITGQFFCVTLGENGPQLGRLVDRPQIEPAQTTPF